jgi:hypothetical protein
LALPENDQKILKQRERIKIENIGRSWDSI